jgi:hypothetical protein
MEEHLWFFHFCFKPGDDSAIYVIGYLYHYMFIPLLDTEIFRLYVTNLVNILKERN